MDLFNSKLVDYLHELAVPDDEVVREMEDYARKKNFPIVGPLVGRLCFQLVKMLSARRIFEMGSGFGYSAYWMAKA
ncbi:MAG: O-methyltransferase, partial [Calditrichaeota bacterium]